MTLSLVSSLTLMALAILAINVRGSAVLLADAMRNTIDRQAEASLVWLGPAVATYREMTMGTQTLPSDFVAAG